MKERNIYSTRRATERARAITNMKKAKARRARIIISTVALSLVAVVAAGALLIGTNAVRIGNNNAAPLQTVTTDQNAANAGNNNTQAVQTAAVQTTSQNTAAASQQSGTDRIDNVNGERVYIDTKRTAPATTGTAYHYYAYGKTSYGFDWTYNTDNSNFVIRCDYNFNQQQYDFQFYGTTPGTAHVTLYYNTDDNVQVPVSLTLTVDNNLNVTAG